MPNLGGHAKPIVGEDKQIVDCVLERFKNDTGKDMARYCIDLGIATGKFEMPFVERIITTFQIPFEERNDLQIPADAGREFSMRPLELQIIDNREFSLSIIFQKLPKRHSLQIVDRLSP